MGIDEAIERLKGIIIISVSNTAHFKNFKLMYQDVDAIETIVNEYNNLKQIEEAHRIENGKLREEIKDLKETLDNAWSGFKGIQEDLTNQLRNTPPAEYC